MNLSLFFNCDTLPGKNATELYQEVEEQTVRADELGFEGVWMAEHHFELSGRLPSPLVFLSRLSGLTSRIKLGTAIIQAPYHQPIRLAEDAALLDLISGGRVRLGLGSGAKNNVAEFERFGVPLDEKSARMLETVEIVHQAFENGRIDFQGRFYQYQDIPTSPRPTQAAGEILWLAASDHTWELAGRREYGLLLPRVISHARARELVDQYRSALPSGGGRVAPLCFAFPALNEREAREQTREAVAFYAKRQLKIDWNRRTDTEEYGQILERLNFIIGVPEQVIEQLERIATYLDADEILCQVYAAGSKHGDSLRALELLGHEILPALAENTPV